MTVVLDLPPELERQLEAEALRRRQALPDCARTLIEERLAATPAAGQTITPVLHGAVGEYEGLPRGSVRELVALAASQGAPLCIDWDRLPTDPAPDEETGDEFLAWLREGRRDPDDNGRSGEP